MPMLYLVHYIWIFWFLFKAFTFPRNCLILQEFCEQSCFMSFPFLNCSLVKVRWRCNTHTFHGKFSWALQWGSICILLPFACLLVSIYSLLTHYCKLLHLFPFWTDGYDILMDPGKDIMNYAYMTSDTIIL